jgi:hypothetical protein
MLEASIVVTRIHGRAIGLHAESAAVLRIIASSQGDDDVAKLMASRWWTLVKKRTREFRTFSNLAMHRDRLQAA